jgi:hypothetical protein
MDAGVVDRTRRVRLGGAVGFAAAALTTLVLAPSANAAQTFGSNLAAPTDTAVSFGPPARTFTQGTLPAGSAAAVGITSPIDGVVVRWRIKTGSETVQVIPRITRPGNSQTRTGAGTGAAVTPGANTTTTTPTRLPVLAGDGFGIEYAGSNLRAFALTVPAVVYSWNPSLVDMAAPVLGSSQGNTELLVNADVEADADGDGHGDETQDLCPTDASTQATCPAVASPPPASAPQKCKRLRKKLKRQKRGLARAGSQRKRSLIQGNIKDTRKRLVKLSC